MKNPIVKLRRALSIVFALVFLTGCVGLDKERVLTPSSGYLQTPDGNYRFKEGDDTINSRIPRFRSSIETFIYAENDAVLVRMQPWSAKLFLSIYSFDGFEKIKVDYINSSYQTGNDNPVQIPFSDIVNSDASSEPQGRIRVDSQLTSVQLFGLKISDWSKSFVLTEEKIRYRIPFSVGDSTYLIDVTTQYRNSYSPEILLWGPSSP